MNNAQETILKESKSNGEMAQGSDSPLERLVIRQPQSIALNEDCMNVMNRYSDKFFALAIVDPPYGKKPVGHFGQKSAIRFDASDVLWDIKPSKEYFVELRRVSQNQIIWGGNYFIDNLEPTNCFIVWDKENGENPYADCELAWTSFDSVTKIFRYFWLGSHIHRKETVVHPTQKPIALYSWICKTYAHGGNIFDSHLGSGSSRIACHKAGLDFVGCEIDSDYFQAQEKRFNEYLLQVPMQFAAV